MNNFFYKVNDKDYEVVITHKRIKNIHYRYKDGKFYVSCNPITLKRTVVGGLDKFAAKLIEKGDKSKAIGDDYIYLFGDKFEIAKSGMIRIEGYPQINYKNQEELLKKLKKIFQDIVTKRVRYYENIMNLPSYRVTIRNMSSRHGSNSKSSKHLTFAFHLIHYSTPILDSVIVHELAHIKVYNHSKAFYDVVYKYCPDYDRLHTKLRKGEFK